MMKSIRYLLIGALIASIAPPAFAAFKAEDKNGHLRITDDGKQVFGWQYGPLENPEGGAKFAALSAFIHPLKTPAGFMLTRIQPGDHLHHLGVWWPWKILEVDGKPHITWELQAGEGRSIGVSAKITRQSDDQVVLELRNRHEISRDGIYIPVLDETTTLTFGRMKKDSYVVDLDIRHKAVEGWEPKVAAYRYSGFSWRGPASWNRSNSTMLTSGGHHRDNANHQTADWLMVTGKADSGDAAFLMMSAAAKNAGTPEKLRVWPTATENGAQFANFNPVVEETLPLSDPRVAHRRYRLIAADRIITAPEADKLWADWN